MQIHIVLRHPRLIATLIYQPVTLFAFYLVLILITKSFSYHYSSPSHGNCPVGNSLNVPTSTILRLVPNRVSFIDQESYINAMRYVLYAASNWSIGSISPHHQFPKFRSVNHLDPFPNSAWLRVLFVPSLVCPLPRLLCRKRFDPCQGTRREWMGTL